ncbi:MAG: roadblock/LC7 domain-containing protein [Blastocatellia bacterium]
MITRNLENTAMDLTQPLIDLVNRVNGAYGAILTDGGGDIITSYTIPEENIYPELPIEDRMQLIGAYQVINLKLCKQITGQFRLGNLKQMICRYSNASILVQALNDDYALLLALSAEGNLGKGRYYIQHAADLIRQDL